MTSLVQHFQELLSTAINDFILKELGQEPVNPVVLSTGIRLGNGEQPNGDFVLLLIHPSLRRLHDFVDDLSTYVLHQSKSWKILHIKNYHVYKINAKSQTSIRVAFYLHRTTVVQYALSQIPAKVSGPDAKNCSIIVYSSNNVSEWMKLRLSILEKCYINTFKRISATCNVIKYNEDAATLNDEDKNILETWRQTLLQIDSTTLPSFLANIDVKKQNSLFSNAIMFQKALQSNSLSKSLIFLVPSSHLVKCQRAYDLYNLLNNQEPDENLVTFVSVGIVRSKETVQSYLNHLIESVQTEDQSKSLKDCHQIAENCIRFHILSHANHADIDIDNVRYTEPVFILYNAARIIHLMRKSSELRIDRSNIDFHHLCGDSEWSIIVNNIIPYLVQNGTGNEVPSFNQTCHYLKNLVHTFSVYYSHVKVFLQPQPHTLSIIAARVYFVEQIYKIIANCFDILCIKELSDM